MAQLGAAELAVLTKNLDDSQKMIFQSQYNAEKKDRGTATIVALFNWDRIWFGDLGLGILKLITAGLCGIWWLIDLFTAGSRCDEYNRAKAQEIVDALKVSNPKSQKEKIEAQEIRNEITKPIAPKSASQRAKFCSNCGNSLAEGEKFCPSCGQRV
jgi:ribosomal protein S27AE